MHVLDSSITRTEQFPLSSLIGKSFLSIDQITSPDQMQALFSLADFLKEQVSKRHKLPLLDGYMIPVAFYEVSTRTYCSFCAAALRLGANIIPNQEMRFSSSDAKGEILEDSMRALHRTSAADLVILRHFDDLSSKRAANAIAPVPLVNGGSGRQQHPTQATLDAYTTHHFHRKVRSKAYVGDLKHGRTVQSGAQLDVILYPGIHLHFVSPDELQPPRELTDYVTTHGATYSLHRSLKEVIEKCDVLYMTRIQRERFEDPSLFEQVKGRLILTNSLAELMKPDAIILHPLPRNDEISYDVDTNPRARYFDQMECGLYIRMALLCVILNRIPREAALKQLLPA